MAKHSVEQAAPVGKSRYVPALDGLRAFAVLAVIAYHMKLGWAPGGLMGVTVFFVISGYLINGLLVAEHERAGRISLGAFWMRRVRRLLPAIVLSVAGTAALCTVFNPGLLDKMRPDIVPSLLFFNNWWQIFRDLSYFEAAGAPSPLIHFWSLSIEEQFYLVWPPLLVLMYHLGLKKRTIATIVLVLAVLSGVEMAALYEPGADPSRIYYGTDTRAMSLLLGVWLSFALPSAAFGRSIRPHMWSRAKRLGVNVVGVAAFAGLVAIVAFTNGFSAFPYLGGIAITSVLSAVVIGVLVVPRSWLAVVFACKPLVYIGKRSYSMYLWHLPILLLTTNANSATQTPWWMYLLQLALIIGASELSFRFVEDPIRKRKLSQWIAGIGKDMQHSRKDRYATARVAVPALCFAAMCAVAGYGVATVPQGAGTADVEQAVEHEEVEPPPRPSAEELGIPDLTTYEGMFLTPRANEEGGPVYEPLLIGDSVSLGAEAAFYEVFPYGHLDSVVSRNIWESPYGDYLARHEVGEFVIFCLGTNNAVVDEQIDELLASVDESKYVVLVNTRSYTDWFQSTNEAIARAPERHPNVTVVDWYTASEGHEEYFAGDGTHLTSEGAHAYVALIQQAVQDIYDRTSEERAARQEQAERAADIEQRYRRIVGNFF